MSELDIKKMIATLRNANYRAQKACDGCYYGEEDDNEDFYCAYLEGKPWVAYVGICDNYKENKQWQMEENDNVK